MPAKPVVLVGTPSIDFERKLTSSTYTPGDRYSGIAALLAFSRRRGGPRTLWVDEELGLLRQQPPQREVHRAAARCGGHVPRRQLLPRGDVIGIGGQRLQRQVAERVVGAQGRRGGGREHGDHRG